MPHNKSANPPRREKLKTTAAVAGMGATPGFGSGGSGLPGAMTSFPATSQTAVGGYPVTSNRLAEAIMVEETQGDPNAAARAYESLMSGFDQQRSAAAQAIFRLAEVYRRSGRNEEARTLHGRILREFVDFPELAQSSLRILSFNAPPLSAAVPAPADPAPTAQRPFDAAAYRVESLRLMQRELARRKDLVSKGLVSESEIFPLERDILQLQQQIARDEDIATSPNFDHPPAAKPAAGR